MRDKRKIIEEIRGVLLKAASNCIYGMKTENNILLYLRETEEEQEDTKGVFLTNNQLKQMVDLIFELAEEK